MIASLQRVVTAARAMFAEPRGAVVVAVLALAAVTLGSLPQPRLVLGAALGVPLTAPLPGAEPAQAAVPDPPATRATDQVTLLPTAEPAPLPTPVLEPDEPAVPAPSPEPSAEPATPAPAPPAPPVEERIPLLAPAPGHEAFAGLSTWIDLYDVEWTPHEQVAVASAAGVDTIFVQSARFNSPDDIHDPARFAALIEAAHDRGIRVMTWYIPDFLDLEKDYRRAVAAIGFTTPRGDRADAFGLDIELSAEPDIGLRNARLLALSRALRAAVGSSYPMAAIVLPPLQLDLNGTWWPGFPYAELRPFYDVYIPMSYSSYRGTDDVTTRAWNLQNVAETRRRAGDPNLPVHLAGGIADNLPEVGAFVQAAREGNVLGAGLYDLHTTRSSAWPALQALRRTPGTAGPVPSLVGP